MKAKLLSFSFFSFREARSQVEPNRGNWFRCRMVEPGAGPTLRLTFIVKGQSLTMRLARASLPLRKSQVSSVGLTPRTRSRR
jgi:hypothetical protein